MLFPSPCPHCGKENKNKWCYEYSTETDVLYSVCKRQAPPGDGWESTPFTDKEGNQKYRLKSTIKTTKTVRPKQQRIWEYKNRLDQPLMRVVREDDGEGNRRFFQQRWDKNDWKNKLDSIDRADIPIYNYQAVQSIIETDEPIWVVEGESCCDALDKLGFTAVTNLGGSGKWRDSDTADLKGGSLVVLCPDRDKKGVEHMEQIESALTAKGVKTQWMLAFPDSPLWENLPENGGLDVVDWIGDGATRDDILNAVIDRPVLKEPITPIPTQSDSPIGGFDYDAEEPLRKFNVKKLTKFIKHFFWHRLRFNELTKSVELDGKKYDVDNAYIDIANDHSVQGNRVDTANLFLRVAKENPYSPIEEYLKNLVEKIPVSVLNEIDLDHLSSLYLGTTDPLYDVFLKKFLIAAVARVFQPGCQVDTALVLQSKQGCQKSTFLKILGGKWFTDSMGDGQNKDDLLILHKHWILEWGEIEKLFGKKQASDLKPFISRRQDSFREPYGKSTEEYDRHSIIVGSTNKQEFLMDETGNRRYWVIPVEKKINIEQLQQERDAIWASAVLAYRSGERWWLSDAEEELSNQNNEQYVVSDTWEDVIIGWIEQHDKDEVTIREIQSEALGIEIAQQDRRSQRRVSDILTRAGWTSKPKGKTRKRVWRKDWNQVGGDRAIEGGDRIATELTSMITPPDHPSNNDTARVSEKEIGIHAKKDQKTFIFSEGDSVIYKGERFNGDQKLFDSIGNPKVVRLCFVDKDGIATLRTDIDLEYAYIRVEKLEKWQEDKWHKNGKLTVNGSRHQKQQDT